MLDWLKNAWNWAGNSFDAIANWVSGLFATLYTYVDNWITQIIRGIQDVANYVTACIRYSSNSAKHIQHTDRIHHRIYNDIQKMGFAAMEPAVEVHSGCNTSGQLDS